MPRWKALPEDLEPQIREFTGRLRRLVDDSGLSIAALADRTGYGKTSWERYLGGRLLAPKGAVIALAEATGTDPGPLATLWEQAERAWTRAKLRHDHTLTALDITDARAALGDLGTKPEPAGEPAVGKTAGSAGGKAVGTAPGSAGGKAVGTAVGSAGVKTAGSAGGETVGSAEGKAVGTAPGSARGKAVGTAVGSTGGKAVGTAAGSAGVKTAGSAEGKAVGTAAGSAGGKAVGTAPGSAGSKTAGTTAGSAAASGGGFGARPGSGSRAGSDVADAPPKNSWGLAGYRGPSKATARPGTRPPAGPADPAGTPAGAPAGTARTPASSIPSPGTPARTPGQDVSAPTASPDTPARTPSTPGTPGTRTPQARPASPVARWSARRQQVVMFFAGLVGAGALIAGVFFFTHGDGGGRKSAGGASPSPSASARTSPPPGVKCAGAACTGKDAEAMGCSGELVTTAKTATVGTTTVEVRYSKACGTAWGRITSGAPGDTVRVSVGKDRQTGDITAAGDTIGYTPMIAVRNPAQARACATLAAGQTGCTE
ncbi:DUF2690 domain-containing protein [Streptomyces cyanogenus]|uniref:HTH cro/C1-type domain-containing protein n=1 Tax=Streptomyces cyanogenus TaxID=80860 RepID=A0ABX7TZ20_STRCY|nr:DUF2690 domain-containing protein [Streptomyces cyanogenus]QTE00426.1 hypothetical protein S1361_24050 [Streptomyces cyanogenus]